MIIDFREISASTGRSIHENVLKGINGTKLVVHIVGQPAIQTDLSIKEWTINNDNYVNTIIEYGVALTLERSV